MNKQDIIDGLKTIVGEMSVKAMQHEEYGACRAWLDARDILSEFVAKALCAEKQ